MQCTVCKITITDDEVSEFAAYAGLPSPCCQICFSVNDYRIKSTEELAAKSVCRRFFQLMPKNIKLRNDLMQLLPSLNPVPPEQLSSEKEKWVDWWNQEIDKMQDFNYFIHHFYGSPQADIDSEKP